MKKILLSINVFLLSILIGYAQHNGSFQVNGEILAEEQLCKVESTGSISLENINYNDLIVSKISHWSEETEIIKATKCSLDASNSDAYMVILSIPESSTAVNSQYWPVHNVGIGIELMIDGQTIFPMGNNVLPNKNVINGASYLGKARAVMLQNDIKIGNFTLPIIFNAYYL